jgi:hypothetical protein
MKVHIIYRYPVSFYTRGKKRFIEWHGYVVICIPSVCSSNAAGATPTATLLPSLSSPAGLCHRSYLESNGELHIVGAMVSTFHET